MASHHLLQKQKIKKNMETFVDIMTAVKVVALGNFKTSSLDRLIIVIYTLWALLVFLG